MDSQEFPKKKCSNPYCQNPNRDSGGCLPATTEYFRKDRHCKFGVSSRCKFCKKTEDHQYFLQNKKTILEQCKGYRETHKEQIAAAKHNCYIKKSDYYKEKVKKWESEHKEYVQQRNKKYRQDHLEEIREKDLNRYYANYSKIRQSRKLVYEKNKEKILKQRKESYNRRKTKDPEKIRKRARDYVKKKCYSDLNFRLRQRLRKRIWDALKGHTKSKKTQELIGCSIKELKIYLEKQFTEEITWDNYGSFWHIDHILPCAAFDLRNSEEQEICFHFTNLQPLSKEDNLRKHTKIL